MIDTGADEISKTVLQLASEVFETEVESLALDVQLANELGATSVSLLEFSVVLERRFGLAFDHEKLVRLQNLGDFAALISHELRQLSA